MEVSLLLTGRGAVADSPTLGRHAHASVQSGHDRAPAGGMPTASQPYGGRMSPSHPTDALGTLPNRAACPAQSTSRMSPPGVLATRIAGRLVVPSGRDARWWRASDGTVPARAEERLAVGPRWRESGLVFTWPDGRPIHPQRFSTWFEQLARAAGLPRIRLHDVRHSYATAALAAGIPAKVVSERLGHATIAITMDTYSHVLPGLGRRGRRHGRQAHPGRLRPRAGASR